MPAWKAKLLSHLPGMPFNRDQVVMSQENSICSNAKLINDFEIKLAYFDETLSGYASQLINA